MHLLITKLKVAMDALGKKNQARDGASLDVPIVLIREVIHEMELMQLPIKIQLDAPHDEMPMAHQAGTSLWIQQHRKTTDWGKDAKKDIELICQELGVNANVSWKD